MPGSCSSTCPSARRRCAAWSRPCGPAGARPRMVSALRPGGWLLVEDFDIDLQPLVCPDEVTPDQRLANRIKADFRELLRDRGADMDLGRRLPRMFREAGLTAVGADAYFPLAMPPVAALERANTRQVRDALVGRGTLGAQDIDRYLDL